MLYCLFAAVLIPFNLLNGLNVNRVRQRDAHNMQPQQFWNNPGNDGNYNDFGNNYGPNSGYNQPPMPRFAEMRPFQPMQQFRRPMQPMQPMQQFRHPMEPMHFEPHPQQYYGGYVRNFETTNTGGNTGGNTGIYTGDKTRSGYVCECHCPNNSSNDRDDCFSSECKKEVSKCLTIDECKKAIAKTDKDACDGSLDCGNADLMCANGNPDCKAAWNEIITCAYNCHKPGYAGMECVKQKCNDNGDVDACHSNALCKKAAKNTVDGKCDKKCDNADYMCGGDATCKTLWQTLINCFGDKCDDSKSTTKQRKTTTLVVSEVMQRYNQRRTSRK